MVLQCILLFQNCLEDKKADRKKWHKKKSKRKKNCLRKYFHSFKYLLDHANVHFFLLISFRICSHSLNDLKFTQFHVIPSVLLHASFLTCLWPCKFQQSEHMNSLKTIRVEELFSNVNLSNLEKVLQRNLRTNRAMKCIFRKSGSKNFENLPARRKSCRRLCGLIYILVCSKNSW